MENRRKLGILKNLIYVCNMNISHISKALIQSEFSIGEITVLVLCKTVPHIILSIYNQLLVRYKDGKLPTEYEYVR
jgi:hypothetical protein